MKESNELKGGLPRRTTLICYVILPGQEFSGEGKAARIAEAVGALSSILLLDSGHVTRRSNSLHWSPLFE